MLHWVIVDHYKKCWMSAYNCGIEQQLDDSDECSGEESNDRAPSGCF